MLQIRDGANERGECGVSGFCGGQTNDRRARPIGRARNVVVILAWARGRDETPPAHASRYSSCIAIDGPWLA